jgi:serine protease Do
MSRTSRPRLLALVLIAGLLAGCTAAGTPARVDKTSAEVAPELARFNELLSTLAERLRPTLVHVRAQREAPAREESTDPQEPRRSQGSGFIIEPNGVIVTNAHVVEGSATVQVRFFDGRRFPAKVIGRDNRVDLALLKVEGVRDLPTLVFADSNRVRVGELVLALGHPFGLEHSVSFGIVSRKGAPLTVAAPGFDFIQTDAAINPGNSGGPLVNMAGEVVGVNSMAARNGSIGFAIPSNLVKMLVPQLQAKGKVEWGWLGVSIAEIGEDDIPRLRLREPRGVLIRAVTPGDPADRGGVRANDVILALDGTKLEGPRDLQRLVASAPVGKKVKVTLWREGKETEVEVTIGRYVERTSEPE